MQLTLHERQYIIIPRTKRVWKPRGWTVVPTDARLYSVHKAVTIADPKCVVQ